MSGNTMAKPFLNMAVQTLGQTATDNRLVSVFDPSAWFPWILQLVQSLMLCQPTPAGAAAWLTWRPLWWILGTRWSYANRLAAHRGAIDDQMRVAFRKVYAGPSPASDFDAVRASIWDAIDAGKLTPAIAEGLYADAR